MEATNEMNNIETCVYVLKTYKYDNEKEIINTGLWEDEYGNKQFDTEEEARTMYKCATNGDEGYMAVYLIRIDPTSNEDRETIIDKWEDYMNDED